MFPDRVTWHDTSFAISSSSLNSNSPAFMSSLDPYAIERAARLHRNAAGRTHAFDVSHGIELMSFDSEIPKFGENCKKAGLITASPHVLC